MEAKLVKIIEEKLEKDSKTLRIENTCMLKISPALGEAINKKPELSSLSLTSCKLANLKGLALLEKLESLDLSENNLTDAMTEEYLKRCGKTLKKLFLAGNKIEKADCFSCLKDEKLRQLDLMGCPISSQKDYRKELFDMLPSLRIVDGLNKEGKEVSVFDSEEEAEEAEANEEENDMNEFIEKDEEKENEPTEKEVFKMDKRATNELEEGDKDTQEKPTTKIQTS